MNSCNSFSWTHLLFQWICPACACAELFSTVCLRTTMQPKSYLLRDPSIRSMSLHFGDKDAMRDKYPARIQEDDKPRVISLRPAQMQEDDKPRFLHTLHESRRMIRQGDFSAPCTIPAVWQAPVSLHPAQFQQDGKPRFLCPVIRTRPSACLFINTWCELPILPRGLTGPDAPQERQSFYILGGKKTSCPSFRSHQSPAQIWSRVDVAVCGLSPGLEQTDSLCIPASSLWVVIEYFVPLINSEILFFCFLLGKLLSCVL